MRSNLDLSSLPHRLVGHKTALRVDKVRRENSVDERRLAQPSLTYKNHEIVSKMPHKHVYPRVPSVPRLRKT
jgi:hypothetical protein